METKICSYTEKNARLQLVKVDDRIELRLNRKIVNVWSGAFMGINEARLYFASAVHNLCVLRSSDLSYLAF